jgi:starch synthase
MRKPKVLFISQEIMPYTEETHISRISRMLPQGIQEKGKDIRTFMPRFGSINERRNQLHEVIRLSGMNLIIDDSDHPLIIKVASIQAARMQVYFIDNEEYFQRKFLFRDAKNKFYPDNDDRSIFFCRGVLETVKKLGWSPDVIHCHGWMTALVPLFIKTSYKDDPVFKNSKIVYSIYDEAFEEPFNENFAKKVKMDGISAEDVKPVQKNPGYVSLNMLAISKSDAVIKGSPVIHPDLESALKKTDKLTLDYKSEAEYIDAFSNLYDELLEEVVLVD